MTEIAEQNSKTSLLTWASLILLCCHPYVTQSILHALWLEPNPPQPLDFTMLEKLGYGIILLVVGIFAFGIERTKKKNRIGKTLGTIALLSGVFWGGGGLLIGLLYISSFATGKPLGP